MSNRRSFLASATMLVCVLGAAVPAARAGDLCINAAQGGPPSREKPIIIARRFRLPKANQCKPVAGVIVAYQSAVTGTACTSYDGDHVNLVLVQSTVGGSPRSYTLHGHLTVETMQGFLERYEDDGINAVTLPMTAYECKANYPDNL